MDSSFRKVAINDSIWQWEYDNVEKVATVYFDSIRKEFWLDIVEIHVKSGLGAGTRRTLLFEKNYGRKLNFSEIRSILAKYSCGKSRCSRGFKRDWIEVEYGEDASLTQIIKNMR